MDKWFAGILFVVVIACNTFYARELA